MVNFFESKAYWKYCKNYLLYIFLNSGYFEKIQYKNLNEFIPRDLWSLAISSNKIAFVVSISSNYEAKIWILALFSKIIATLSAMVKTISKYFASIYVSLMFFTWKPFFKRLYNKTYFTRAITQWSLYI